MKTYFKIRIFTIVLAKVYLQENKEGKSRIPLAKNSYEFSYKILKVGVMQNFTPCSFSVWHIFPFQWVLKSFCFLLFFASFENDEARKNRRTFARKLIYKHACKNRMREVLRKIHVKNHFSVLFLNIAVLFSTYKRQLIKFLKLIELSLFIGAVKTSDIKQTRFYDLGGKTFSLIQK